MVDPGAVDTLSARRGGRVVRVLSVPWRGLVGERMSLPEMLLERYPELTHARWRRGGLFVRLGGWCLGHATVAGITLGRTVWLAPRVPLETELL